MAADWLHANVFALGLVLVWPKTSLIWGACHFVCCSLGCVSLRLLFIEGGSNCTHISFISDLMCKSDTGSSQWYHASVLADSYEEKNN